MNTFITLKIYIFTPLPMRSLVERQEALEQFLEPFLKALSIPPVSTPETWEYSLFQYSPRKVFGSGFRVRHHFGYELRLSLEQDERAELLIQALECICSAYQAYDGRMFYLFDKLSNS